MFENINLILVLCCTLSFGNGNKLKSFDITDKSGKSGPFLDINNYQGNEYYDKTENYPGQYYYEKNEKYDEEYVGNPGMN